MGAALMRGMRALPLVALAVLLLPGPAGAVGGGPVLHEQIPPDPQEDLALEVALDGDLPAALDTRSGLVTAPDPRRPIPPGESPYGAGSNATTDTFAPDRNTKRPDVEGYDEPFTPSTAPFKRLEAFDDVDDHYQLFVRDQRLRDVPLSSSVASDGSEEQFFADMVVNVGPGKRARIPSVGPGARVVRARLGIGSEDLAFHVLRDGAENWFIETGAAVTTPERARLVMELTVVRGSFGGDFGNPRWSDLPRPPDLPENVLRSAREVEARIGVGRDLSPREAVGKLVNYFRGFTDSDDPPRGRGDIYLDLALSKKGVCRHRAFAFMVTANALGLPTRMVLNEAHAWVEVNDGSLWRRIDLGGAGHMTTPASNLVPERAVFQPPPDVFGWPQGSERGDDMVEDARHRGRMMPSGQPGSGSSSGGSSGGGSTSGAGGGDGENGAGSSSAPANLGAPPGATGASPSDRDPRDERPPSVLTVTSVDGGDAHRGSPLHVTGEVRADGEPCANVVVEVLLRGQNGRLVLLGSLATGEKGTYSGGIVVPGAVPLGDYDVVVRTPGDAKCGRGASY